MLLGAALLAMIGGLASGQAEFAGKSAGEWLKMLREDKNPKVRRVALIALETIGPKVTGVTGGILNALREDPDAEVRQEVALLLGRMGPEAKGAAEALGERLANDKNELVRQAAATALGGKLAKAAEGQVQTLAAALKDKHEGTRRAAAETLKNLGEAAQPAVPQLIEVAKDANADRFSRVYAIQVISQWGHEEKGTAAALIAALGEKGAHLTIRQAAAEGIGRLGGEEQTTVQALAQALENGPLELRKSAALALNQLGAKAAPAWPAMKSILDDRKGDAAVRYPLVRAAASVARQHAEAVLVLAKLAQDDEAAENRLIAIRELGELGAVAEKAAPALEALAQGEARAELRNAAQASLKKIKG
jgi:HEAT repeat protein